MIKKRDAYRPWTDEQSSLAVYLYYQGATFKEIGRKVGHGPSSVNSHLTIMDFGRKPHMRRRKYIRLRPPTGEPPPAVVDRDRQYRQSLLPRSITASIFGDPLPGYSALERRA